MMRGVLHSLFVVCALGGIAAADPGDPMPAEQTAPAQKFETVPAKQIDAAPHADEAKPAAHKAKHSKKKSARKHKKTHHKAASKTKSAN